MFNSKTSLALLLNSAGSLAVAFLASAEVKADYQDAGPATPAQMSEFCPAQVQEESTPFVVRRYNPKRQLPFEMIDCTNRQLFLYDCGHLKALETLEDRYVPFLRSQGKEMSPRDAYDFKALRSRLRPYIERHCAPPPSV